MWHHFGGYSKTRYRKLVTHVESHVSAASLLESYVIAINNIINVYLSAHVIRTLQVPAVIDFV